jgi:hypothetical protein
MNSAHTLVTLALVLAPLQARADECLAWDPRQVAGPSPRGEFGFAYDSSRGRVVLVGGANTFTFASVFRQTWEWDGSVWDLRSTEGPSARCDNACAFDSIRGVTVSFGGFNGAFLGDTWEWNGTLWTQRVVAGPSVRADSFMVFDEARGVMVLFGGLAPGSVVLGDHWEWDGQAWTPRTIATPPPARWIHRMAYDAQRNRVVLFGGAAGAVLGDTWEFDGTDWAHRQVTGPPARYGHGMAYDRARSVTVLFGGQTGVNYGQGVLGDTWEWNGSAWMQRFATGPVPRSFTKIVYDADHQRTVAFGGYNGSQFIADTWELGEAFANCDGSSIPPVLNVNDFVCFQSRFAAGHSSANCDHSTAPPVLNVNDFVCFISRFAAGCA